MGFQNVEAKITVVAQFRECVSLFVFQDFYDEQAVFSENFWPQSEPPQAMAFNPRGRVSKALTPPPTTQSINNQVSEYMKSVLCERAGPSSRHQQRRHKLNPSLALTLHCH